MLPHNQTRSKDTTRKYMERAQQLLRNIPVSYMADPEGGFHPMEIVAWLKDTAPGLRKASFRQYKAALVCYMENMSHKYVEEADDYMAGINGLKVLSNGLAAPRTSLAKRTSSGKVKLIKLDDLLTLCQSMVTAMDTIWKPRACLWLVAGMAAGLRPIEWQTAQILEHSAEGGLVIHVINAKNTNGRASGDTRKIPVEPGWMVEYVLKHIKNIQAWLASGKSFKSYYETCGNALAREVRSLWPNSPSRHYSLYSGRHQFCANLKKASYTSEEIAQLMGHASTDTAKEHYGKRRSGHGGMAHKMKMPSLATMPTPG